MPIDYNEFKRGFEALTLEAPDDSLIDYNEFKRGETHGSWEQIIFQILGDGKAYSLSELETEVGIISLDVQKFIKDDKYRLAIGDYIHDDWLFRHTLNEMVEEGRIASKLVYIVFGKTKDKTKDKIEQYYVRKDLFKK